MTDLNPELQKAHDAAAEARTAMQKAQTGLEIALGELIKATGRSVLAERDVRRAAGESMSDIASYFAMIAEQNTSEWSGGPTSSRNIGEALVRKAALRMATDPTRRSLFL